MQLLVLPALLLPWPEAQALMSEATKHQASERDPDLGARMELKGRRSRKKRRSQRRRRRKTEGPKLLSLQLL